MKILVINGVNLHMLGKRDVSQYGHLTLKELENVVCEYGKSKGVEISCVQSNFEGEIVEYITNSKSDAIIINPGAYSHYSYAIRDAIECVNVKVVEVHLSDILNREDFRKVRVLEDVVDFAVWGKKQQGYFEAIDYLVCKI